MAPRSDRFRRFDVPSRKEAGRGRISGLSVVRCGMGILPLSGELFEPRARRPCHFRQHSRTTDNPEMRPLARRTQISLTIAGASDCFAWVAHPPLHPNDMASNLFGYFSNDIGTVSYTH